MKSKREKVTKAFQKGMVEAKKGYKAIKKYGPGVHRGLGRVAESIQEGLAVSPRMVERKGRMVMRKPERMKKVKYLKISKKGKARMVDFNRLAIG